MNCEKDQSDPLVSFPQSQEQELQSLRYEKAAMSAVIWNLVRLAAPDTHSAEVGTMATDPLWQLAFVQSSNPNSGRIKILAGAMKPITEQEKKRVVRLLRGTSTPMHTALLQLELPHPPSYVEKEIHQYLWWQKPTKDAAGYWFSVTRTPLVESAKNLIGLPKS